MKPSLVLARFAALVLALATGSPACGAPERLAAEREGTLEIREVSGLATGDLQGFGPVVLAIGDESSALTIIPLVDGTPDPQRARVMELPITADKSGSQFEGVTISAGRVFVLSEGPNASLSELDVTPDHARLVRTGPLVVPPDHPLASAWEADPNALGEGVAVALIGDFVTSGPVTVGDTVLVAKQTKPAVLVAFRFEGGRWIAGRTWNVDTRDISDLALGPDDALFSIGADDGAICQLAILPPAGGHVGCVARWALPEALGRGEPRWEGLAFLPDGRPIVAVDRKKTESPNFAILPKLLRKSP